MTTRLFALAVATLLAIACTSTAGPQPSAAPSTSPILQKLVTESQKPAVNPQPFYLLKEGDEILLEKPAPAKVDGAQKKGAA